MEASPLPARLVVVRSILPVIFVLLTSSTVASSPVGCYQSIISFGDSLADTGNLPLLCRSNAQPCSAKPPYGQTFFHRPTGRFSNGRIVLDFIAESLGLPFVQPYLGIGSDFSKGVNFAVGGATALDHGVLEERGIYNPMTNVSLGTQLDWFRQFLASISDGRKYLESALVLVGEIGGNDYNYPLQLGNDNTEVIQSLVPLVVKTIGSAIEDLIKLGAKTILVPGNFPIGCLPMYLTLFKTANKEAYDSKTGCLNWLSRFSEYHNEHLQKELNRIQKLHPHAAIIYADYYNAMMRLYLTPQEFGFGEGILRACCGAGGTYNFNFLAQCGIMPAKSCADPSSFVSWDGIHFTEAAYRLIAEALLQGAYTIPNIRAICPSASRVGSGVSYI